MSPFTEPGGTTFADVVAAYAASQGLPPFEAADLSGSPLRQRLELVRRHGPDDDGFGEWVYPGRTVIDIPGHTWAAPRPEDCADESMTGIWFDVTGRQLPANSGSDRLDGIVLLCPQCGLDST